MIRAWVIGSGGLLGSALCRKLFGAGTELFFPAERFCWESEHTLTSQFATAVEAFAAQAGMADRWEIYWGAGVGTMSSSGEELAQETKSLSNLLRLIKAEPELMSKPGSLVLASSAGAIYAGSITEIISENTPHAPNTAYAHEKLRQEELVRSVVLDNFKITVLVARMSTLYGPGHSASKKQGLLSHIARCILRNQPIHIYVPLDTIRDYLHADDAASSIIATLRTSSDQPSIVTKIIASEQAASIAEIVSIFKRIARRSPRIITTTSQLSSLYLRRVQFRSMVAPDCTQLGRTSLFVGISQVLAAERSAYVQNLSEYKVA